MVESTEHGQSIKKKLLFLTVAIVISAILTIIVYPGVFYSDSYGRWSLALALLKGNRAHLDNWLSFPPQLFMAICYIITGEFSSFTFLSAVMFFFVSFLAIDSFCTKYSIVTCICYALCPVFFGFSIYVEMSVGCVTALLSLLLLILKYDYSLLLGKRGKIVLHFMLCFFLYFCLVGFRQNAFTVLPVLVITVMVISRKIKSHWPITIHCTAMILSLLLIALIPKVLDFGYQYGKGSKYIGLVWEMVCMIKEMPDKYEYMSMLDYLGKEEGATLLSVNAVNYDSINSITSYIAAHKAGDDQNGQRIINNYLMLMKDEPKTFFMVKGRFISRAMGISKPLANVEYDYNRHDRMEEFGYKDTSIRRAFFDTYNRFMDDFSILRRPWVIFSLVIIIVLLTKRILSTTEYHNLLTLYFSAVFFYLSFLITTQSQEFRYFFVPLVLLYICFFACLGRIAEKIISNYRAKSSTKVV